MWAEHTKKSREKKVSQKIGFLITEQKKNGRSVYCEKLLLGEN